MPTCMLLCVLLVPSMRVQAQEISVDQQLVALRGAVEHAEFVRASNDARLLLSHDDLRAEQRNEALELLAIAQIAARDDAGAQVTLRELYARDPNHTPTLRDPGPQVQAAFARAHAAPRSAAAVPVDTRAIRDLHGRTRIEVTLGEGRNAVENVDVFASAAHESMHLVADVVHGSEVMLTLPALLEPELRLYVEARAPSGFVLGRDGSAEAPLKLQVEPTIAAEPAPRGRWWIWTSAAIVVAGAAIAGAIAAH